MRHVSRTHRVALDWLFDRINLDPKTQIKYIDTKNQLADILTKGNFTRDEWNHLLCLFNISHFSSSVRSDTMAKRSQQDSGGKRVTAKSRPMMNLVARTPSPVSSSTLVSRGKRSYGSQNPWSSIAKKDRSGRLDKGTDLFEASDHHYHEQLMESFSSASYSKLKRISNVTGDGEEHSMILGMFMAVTMESATFMGKNFQDSQNSIVNTTDLTLKQMFDRSAKLVSEQDEISSLETIGWENHSCKYLSSIGDDLQRTKVYVFSDSVLCLGKIQQNPESNKAWEQRLGWITSSQSYRNFDGIDEEPT